MAEEGDLAHHTEVGCPLSQYRFALTSPNKVLFDIRMILGESCDGLNSVDHSLLLDTRATAKRRFDTLPFVDSNFKTSVVAKYHADGHLAPNYSWKYGRLYCEGTTTRAIRARSV